MAVDDDRGAAGPDFVMPEAVAPAPVSVAAGEPPELEPARSVDGGDLPPRRRRPFAALAVGVVAGIVIVLGASVVPSLTARSSTAEAEDVVRGYLDAIAAGDATAANASVAPDAERGTTALLTDDVLGSAGRISEP